MNTESNVTFVLGPTNTGKTFYAIERMSTYDSGMIGLPLRLLAREVYDKIILKKGKLSAALITGEEQIIPPKAKYFICTVEAMPTNKLVDFVAIDEIQLCNDYERGHIFTEKLLYARGNIESLFLGSDTMEPLIKKLFPYSNIIKKNRRSKLTYIGKKSFFSLPKRSAVVAFRTVDVYNIAARIKSQKGGAAVVLGALSPQTRNSQVDMFEAGEVDYIVATDAIGMGLNLNIENVSFASLEKYDGKKERYLKKNEIAQIAGRAGRNEKDGFFSNTFKTGLFSKELVQSIEQNLFDPIDFLYWRNKDLEFNSIESLLNSLNKKSNDPLLIKTLNIRDENILKHLSVNSEIVKYLSNYDCIKILWEISKIPDYMKSLDYKYSDLLVKLYINLVTNGKINYDWVMDEIVKLQNIEGSIEELTFKLSKTRFWNYVTNKNQWFDNNSNLKEIAKETENILSKALHQTLIKEFVDNKLNVLVKEITLDKNLEIVITNKKEIVLNKKIIGNIVGIQAKLFDQESYKKNKSIYNTIVAKVSEAINRYILAVLNDKKFIIKINENLDIIYNKYKIASLYKGQDIFSPKLIISNNKYISKENYNLLKAKIQYNLLKLIKFFFEEQKITVEGKNQNIKAIIFSLQKNLGIIKISEIIYFYKLLNSDDLNFLKKNDIIISSNYIYYKHIIVNQKIRITRWLISSLYFNKDNFKPLPNKKFFYNKYRFNALSLKSIGYIKLKSYSIKISFLESIYNLFLSEEREVYYFNYYHIRKLKIPFIVFFEILNHYNFEKISGTNFINFWTKINRSSEDKITYNESSPFFVLKKLL